METLKEVSLFNIKLTQASRDEVLEFVFKWLESSREKLHIFTPNPEMVMYATKHEEFRAILNSAEINLADGVGLQVAASLLQKTPLERISGVDFMEILCKESVRKAVTVGFLGGRNSVALKAAKCLQEKYPGLRIRFVGEEWEKGEWIPREYTEDLFGFEKAKSEASSSLTPRVHLMPEKEIDILFVAFGHPKQEEWILAHSDLPFRVAMGVGGAFDYLGGNVSRAPQPMRKVGLEWFYRLVRQPWRLKRQLALLGFIHLVLKERFSHTS